MSKNVQKVFKKFAKVVKRLSKNIKIFKKLSKNVKKLSKSELSKNVSKIFLNNLSIICPFAQIVWGRRRRRRRRRRRSRRRRKRRLVAPRPGGDFAAPGKKGSKPVLMTYLEAKFRVRSCLS
jgi:hypothetical protein